MDIIKPCPFCGHFLQSLEDAYHKSMTAWRWDPVRKTRSYVSFRDPGGFDGQCWEIHCLVHEGGCGAMMMGDSEEEVLTLWNRREVTMSSNFMINVPAGRYFLGDPCYVINSDHEWLMLLNSCDFFDGSPIGVLPSGKKVLAFRTEYGDGIYYDQEGYEFGVDAGLIGLVPEEAISRPEGVQLGLMVEFLESTLCSRHEGGTLVFGDFVIRTGYEEDEDEL